VAAILIVGAGGVGLYYGGLLARGGEEVALLARGAALEALRQGELTVRSERSGNFKVRLPVVAAASEAGQPELVLLCVKTYDLEPAVQALLPALTPTTVVLPLENGIEVPGVVCALLRERATVLGAAAYLEATRLGPDLVEQTGGSCRIALGELDGALSRRASAIAQRLLRADIPAAAVENIGIELWSKFAFICAFGLCAVCATSIGKVLETDAGRGSFRALLEEGLAVGRAMGVALPGGRADKLLEIALGLPVGMRSSLQRDLAAGRPTEVEALQGALRRLGLAAGVPTPCTSLLDAALTQRQRRATDS